MLTLINDATPALLRRQVEGVLCPEFACPF